MTERTVTSLSAGLAQYAHVVVAPPNDEHASLRERMYRAYASHHAGLANAAAEVCTADSSVVPFLSADRQSHMVDIGCGQGVTVKALQDRGYARAEGVDFSEEQVALARRAGISDVHYADLCDFLTACLDALAAVIATDVLEHCNKTEVLRVLDAAFASLRVGGVLIARVPNSASSSGGRTPDGDFTHEISFNARSVDQSSNVVGFRSARVPDTSPVRHGPVSRVRWLIWLVASSLMRLALAAETGEVRRHHVGQTVILAAHK